MNRLRIVVLGLWAAGLAILLIEGRYSLFIRAQLWPLLLGTIIMFVLFLIAMYVRRQAAIARKATAAVWLRSALLLLPLAYMFPAMSDTASASGLNSFALRKRALGLDSGTDVSGGAPDQVPADGSRVISMGYILRHRHKLDGRRVVTEGRVFKDDSLPPGQVKLFRFVVVCCAADAMPVQALIASPLASSLKDDEWVRVDGTFHLLNEGGARVLQIDASKVDAIPAPAEPYLSPYHF
ncbi:MAG TPA: TIGR03943 family protein [Tepidisphaeraceae bacterium]